jgi:TolA-binding protein
MDKPLFSRDQLRDIGLGIGRGFQAYDPNNPFAGAGAALEATIASGMTRDMRAEERKQRLEDLDRAEKALAEREERAEQSMKDREGRIEAMRERERKAESEQQLETEETVYKRQQAREKESRGQFKSIADAMRDSKPVSESPWQQGWWKTLGKYVETTSGRSPVNVYDVAPDPALDREEFDVADPHRGQPTEYTPMGKVDPSFKEQQPKKAKRTGRNFDRYTQTWYDSEESGR